MVYFSYGGELKKRKKRKVIPAMKSKKYKESDVVMQGSPAPSGLVAHIIYWLLEKYFAITDFVAGFRR